MMNNKVAAQSANPTVALLQQREEQLKALVGERSITRFMANTLAQLRRDTKLLRCDPASFYAAAHQAAVLNLQPGPMGEVYLVPYGQQATLITGYKGLLKLARRHPDVANVDAKVVYECEMDDFSIDYGTNEVTHRFHRGPKTKETFVLAYSRVWLANGHKLLLAFERDQIEEVRNRSPAKNSNFWTKDWLAMARKTVIRSHYNGGEVPLSTEVMQALEYELEHERKAEIVVVNSEVPDSPPTQVEVGFGETVVAEDPETDAFGLGEPEKPKKPRGPNKKALLLEIGSLGLSDAQITSDASEMFGETILDIEPLPKADLEQLLEKLHTRI
jgi:recombination protein RecT